MDYSIRGVRKEDLDRVAKVESLCFPPEEAASRKSLGDRINHFPESFLVAELSDKTVIGFINGCVTDEDRIYDEMFEKADAHNPGGAYQSVFGLDVIKEWRGRGVAAALMRRFMEDAEKMGRKGMILTCKERLISYYEKFGYQNRGVSGSVHGGAVWYDMQLVFMDKGK